jgi:hypothetical protein
VFGICGKTQTNSPGFGLKLALAAAEFAEAVGAVGFIDEEVPEQAATKASDAATVAPASSGFNDAKVMKSP